MTDQQPPTAPGAGPPAGAPSPPTPPPGASAPIPPPASASAPVPPPAGAPAYGYPQQAPQQPYGYGQQPMGQPPYGYAPPTMSPQEAAALGPPLPAGQTYEPGHGELYSVLPPSLKKWNWGAFWLNWIWGIGNQSYKAFYCFIPFFNFYWIFVCGSRGNEWAWQNKAWRNVEHFKGTQHTWSLIAWIYIAVSFIPMILMLIWIVFIVILAAAGTSTSNTVAPLLSVLGS
jgi:hypothetical protein